VKLVFRQRPHRPALEVGLGLRPDLNGRGQRVARRSTHHVAGADWEFVELRRACSAG
jgi:hypothetical protein